jgi:hypothetical protein
MSLDILNRFLAEEETSRKPINYLDGPGYGGVRQPRRRAIQRRKGDAKPTPRNVSYRYTIEKAYAAGFRFASVAPKGHVVTVHKTEAEGHRYLTEVLRNSGCTVKPIEAFL